MLLIIFKFASTLHLMKWNIVLYFWNTNGTHINMAIILVCVINNEIERLFRCQAEHEPIYYYVCVCVRLCVGLY